LRSRIHCIPSPHIPIHPLTRQDQTRIRYFIYLGSNINNRETEAGGALTADSIGRSFMGEERYRKIH
jgi:hypothetical protein